MFDIIRAECAACHHTFWKPLGGPDRFCDICKEPTSEACKHEWIWSGRPGGLQWCKHCDVEFDPSNHSQPKEKPKKPQSDWWDSE